MPASARSLRITESYRTRMIGLRNRAKAEAKRTWAKVDPDRLDATFNPGMLVLMTAQLQREAARLSAGYLAAYVSSEKGERVPPPMAVGLDVGKVWTGSSLTKAFRGAVIGTKIQIGDGKEPIEAYKEGGQALVRTAGLAVDDVCRESLRVAMDQSPDVIGGQRAVKGTCEACLGAADGATEEAGSYLDTHPNCQCVSEPVVGRGEWKWKDDEARFSVQPDAAVEAVARTDAAFTEAAQRYTGTQFSRDLNYAIAHGEALTAEQAQVAKVLRGAMEDLPSRPTVWRGVKPNLATRLRSDQEVMEQTADWAEETFRPGSVISTKGFQSSSFYTEPAIDGALAKSQPGVIFEIVAKRGAYLGKVTRYDDEAELLLPDKARFRVRKVIRRAVLESGDSGEKTTRTIVQLEQL